MDASEKNAKAFARIQGYSLLFQTCQIAIRRLSGALIVENGFADLQVSIKSEAFYEMTHQKVSQKWQASQFAKPFRRHPIKSVRKSGRSRSLRSVSGSTHKKASQT